MRKNLFIIITVAMVLIQNCMISQACAAKLELEKTITSGNFGAYIAGALGPNASIEAWEKEIEFAKKAGIKAVRFNSDCWDLFEPVKGLYEWKKLDQVIELLNANGFEIIFTLPISASWNTSIRNYRFEGIDIPKSHFPAKDYADIETMAFNLANRYKGKITYWEVWSKPDYYLFWRGEPNVPEYLEVLKKASMGLRRGNPQCKILLGGVAMPGKDDFVKKLFSLKGEGYFDIMNIHLYTKSVTDMEKAISLNKAAMRKSGFERPLWITEISTTPERFRTSDRVKEEADKAVLLVKYYTIAFAEGVERIFWHTLKNYSAETGLKRNFDFGLLDSDYNILPAYEACAVLASKLNGYQFNKKIIDKKGLRVYKFLKNGSILYVAWTEKIPLSFRINDSYKELLIMDIFGKEIERNTTRKPLNYPLTGSPVYLELKQ